jgi:hypothetical protein
MLERRLLLPDQYDLLFAHGIRTSRASKGDLHQNNVSHTFSVDDHTGPSGVGKSTRPSLSLLSRVPSLYAACCPHLFDKENFLLP